MLSLDIPVDCKTRKEIFGCGIASIFLKETHNLVPLDNVQN